MHIYSFGLTDVGQKRSHNEDTLLIAHDLRLIAVADGMGGASGGEIASELAVRTIAEHTRAAHEGAPIVTVDRARAVLADAVTEANRRIHALAHDQRFLAGMGTTTTAVMIVAGHAVIAHVGDSRAYLVRHQRLVQISDDHSLVNEQVKAGHITREQAKTSPFKNIITRSVGVQKDLEVDVVSLGVEPGDVFLACSDGLSGVVDDADILRIVNDNFAFQAPQLLVDLANARGAPDNVTVVVAMVVDKPVAPTGTGR